EWIGERHGRLRKYIPAAFERLGYSEVVIVDLRMHQLALVNAHKSGSSDSDFSIDDLKRGGALCESDWIMVLHASPSLCECDRRAGRGGVSGFLSYQQRRCWLCHSAGILGTRRQSQSRAATRLRSGDVTKRLRRLSGPGPSLWRRVLHSGQPI